MEQLHYLFQSLQDRRLSVGATLPGGIREVLPSKYLVVTSAVWLRGDTRKLPGLATGECSIFIHTGSITPQKQPTTPNFNSPGKCPEHK